jgi:hypothetical protein
MDLATLTAIMAITTFLLSLIHLISDLWYKINRLKFEKEKLQKLGKGVPKKRVAGLLRKRDE